MRDTLYDVRVFRTFNVIDGCNREALRIEIGTSKSNTRVVRIMNELIEVYGKPEVIRLDNEPELTAHKFVEWAEKHKIELRYIQPGKPNQTPSSNDLIKLSRSDSGRQSDQYAR